ncbi:MAG: amidohydrolase [Firmicutes bacterium]|nr:amidohydrolase [Bacillota bacterium]
MFKILDADGHVIERDADLLEYLDPPYRGNPVLLGYPFFPTLDGFQRGAILARNAMYKDYNITAQTWLNFMDQVGIESTVLYPTAGLAAGMIQDPDWAIAVSKAYNDWFADRYHRVSPSRLRGVALLPLQDPGEAAKELRRAVTELGMVGGLMVSNSADAGVRKPLGEPDFWPIYEEAERLGCPLAFHGAPSWGLGLEAFRQFAPSQSLEHPFAQMIQLTSVVLSGVLERFPTIRMAFLESGTAWIPFMMDRLDRAYEIWNSALYREFSDLVKKKPSDYLREGRVFVSCEGSEETLAYALSRLGEGAVLYASDFPHESNPEIAQREIQELAEREDLTEETKQRIFADNVAAFYRLQG